ncbi:hypothetical protein TRFO_40169 [Tritrichomonas foetus]|uniref:PAS domain-containing protein n=1 Tax=Tritrichomonas foetus TaxID=1144522 RepID=A0A1J4J2H7_9EUKA|nr:hypothetical protein TRFO_40169 [Tritrichomonas foetus]|eukprot:OHS93578.1 hypothetical protein TRFO_40169 [Tritrichomonas foetus]
MNPSSLSKSRVQLIDDSESSKASSFSTFDEDFSSAFSSTIFSDHMHYLTKRTFVPQWIHDILFYYLLFQLFTVVFLPNIFDVFEFTPFIRDFLSIIQYVSLTKPAQYHSSRYEPILIFFIVVDIFEIVCSIIYRFYYNNYRYVSITWCYFTRYISLFVSTIFLPGTTAYCSEFIKHIFSGHAESENNISSEFSFLVVVIQISIILRAVGFHTIMSSSVLYSDMIFKVSQPYAATRAYLSLSICIFISNCFQITENNMYQIHFIIFAIMTFNFSVDLVLYDWVIEKENRLILTFFGFSAISSLVYAFCGVFNYRYEPIIWLISGLDLIVLSIIPSFVDCIVNRALQKLKNPDYVKYVKSPIIAVSDIDIGFRMGAYEAISCKHMKRLLRRFPKNFSLYLTCARMAVVLNSVPLSLNAAADYFSNPHGFSPFKNHACTSVNRIIPPIDELEIEQYKKDSGALLHMFPRLFEDAQSLFDIIVDEVPAILPKVMASYNANYKKIVQYLFNFVQRYPSSPDGSFFVELFKVLYPKSQETRELVYWINNRPEYIKNYLNYFPNLINGLVQHHKLFRSYVPEYHHEAKLLPPVPPLLNDANYKANTNKGPYHHLMTRWFVILIISFTMIFPIISIPFLFKQNFVYLHQIKLLIKGYSIGWQITRAESFVYPLYYYADPNSSLWYYPSQYYAFKDELFTKLLELQNSLTEFSFSIGTGYGHNDKTILRNVMKFMNDIDIDSYQYDQKTSIYQDLMGFTYAALEFATCDRLVLPYQKDFPINDANRWFIHIRNQVEDEVIRLRSFIESINVNVNNVYIDPNAFLIIGLVSIFISLAVVIYIFIQASNNFDIFFTSMRDTSKPVIAQIKQYFNLCLGVIGHHDRQSKYSHYKKTFKSINFMIPIFVLYLLMALCIVVEYLAYNCYNTQCYRLLNLYSDYSLGYINFAMSVTQTLLMYFMDDLEDWAYEGLKRSVEQSYNEFMKRSWQPYSSGTGFCPLCTSREIYVIYIPRGITYEKVFYNFITEMFRLNNADRNTETYTTILLAAIQMYYFGIDMTFVGFESKFTNLCSKYYNQTEIIQIVNLIILLLVILFTGIFIFIETVNADKAFYHIMMLFSRFPDSALSPDTLKILKQSNWQFKSSTLDFDSAMYEDILKALPDSVIVIDHLHNIAHYNNSAELIIDMTEGDPTGMTLFSVLKLRMVAIDEDNNEVPFNEVINNYVLDSRANAENVVVYGTKDNHKWWFSLTILPIFDSNNANQA